MTTLYLAGSVVSATMVNPMLLRVGARSSYLTGLAVFGVSSLVCAAAPNMGVLIAGRALQGVAGGLLTGLMALLVPVSLARVDPSAALPAMKVPVWSLLLIGAAAMAVSVAQIPHNIIATFGLLAASIVLVGLFVIVDWRMHAAILPPSVFGPGPLKWIYLTMGVLMGAAMVNTYVPLFGQRLAHLTPIAAGFLGAALALGWTVSEIVSASLANPRAIGRVIVAAPMVAAAGLALGAVARRSDASVWTAALWAVALLVAGIGIGMAWPHLSARAMASVNDPAEGGAAAAAINTVQLISAAFGAGLAGVVVNTAKGGDVMAAHWLFTVFTALSAAGVAVSYGATRGARQAPRVGSLR